MRIVKDIPHANYKLTLFEMNQRFSLKVENGKHEQWFKFRPGTLTPIQIEESVTAAFFERVDRCFQLMEENQQLSFTVANAHQNEFDEII